MMLGFDEDATSNARLWEPAGFSAATEVSCIDTGGAASAASAAAVSSPC
jgi:hypothetical protein